MTTRYRILVPTDFSACSEAALSTAISLAKGREQSEILLAHVVEASVPAYDEELGVLEPEALRTKMQMLSAMRQHNVPITSVVLHGNPADTIVQLATEKSADVIVMGTRGHSVVVDLLGTVATHVMRSSPCPVLTIHVRPQPGSPKVTSSDTQKDAVK